MSGTCHSHVHPMDETFVGSDAGKFRGPARHRLASSETGAGRGSGGSGVASYGDREAHRRCGSGNRARDGKIANLSRTPLPNHHPCKQTPLERASIERAKMSNDNAPHSKMRPAADAPPGLEQDSGGNIIPLEQRTEEDQEKARAASQATIKDPEREAENPAPMPASQQGQGGSPVDHDPEGQHGATPTTFTSRPPA
jgi:hypothetical protein